jgi:uncharacterized C2H2 Zn-finger protein
MAHKFSMQFKLSLITRRGPNLVTVGGKFNPDRNKCYEYVIKDWKEGSSENVQLAPVHIRQKPWLFGPATILSSRSIVYPCTRGKCSLPCPCMICHKKHPKCRAGQSCGGCKDCKLQFDDHTNFHGCLHYGCKYCKNIVTTLPNFNFFFLDKTKKISPQGVSLEEQLEPRFQLPPATELRRDMISQFLAAQKWPEKLRNWHCGVKDDGIWCVGCNTMFFSMDRLRKHIRSDHNVSKLFRHNCENGDIKLLPDLQCDQCSSSFGTKGELTRHLESIHYKERYECPDCDLTFTRRDSMKAHKRIKHSKAQNEAKCLSLKCETCEKSFSRKSALRRHTIENCNADNKVFVLGCDGCETTFIRTHDLSRHQKKRDNPDGSGKFNCTICDKKMCNRKLLMVHIKAKHDDCKQSLNEFEEIIESRGVERIETFECEFCGKRFNREDSVMMHKVTHNVVDKLQCENCENTFSLKKNYKRHQKEALFEDKTPKHVCYICEKICCTGKLLSGHMSSFHKKMSCPICNQSFTFKHNLERHVGNRVIVTCKDCGKVFCNSKGYIKHVSSEHVNKLELKSV